MATYSVSASELKYASGSSWSSGKARQCVYSGTRYEGAIRFSGLAQLDMSNIQITQIKMSVTFSKSGGSSTKYLTFYKSAKSSISGTIASMRGESLGKLSVGNAYNRTVNLYFDAENNSALFDALKAYFVAGNRILILYVPTTRGTYSGGYCYDYLGVTAMTLTFTYEHLKSQGALNQSSVTAGSPIALNITAYNAAYTHKLTWTFGSHTSVQTAAAGAASATFTVPLSWLDAIPAATSGTASVQLDTLDASGISLGTSLYSFTVMVPGDIVPTVSALTAAPVNDNPVINGWGIYVYGKSKANLKVSGAAGTYGATIRSCTLTTSPSVGSTKDSVLTTGTLYKSGAITATAKVVDTRGRSAEKSASFFVYDYAAPKFSSVQAFRCNADGTQNDANGTYACLKAQFNGHSLDGRNTVTARVVLQQVGGTYSVSAALTSGKTLILGEGRLATDAVYRATITLTDTVGSVSSYTAEIGSVEYVFHVKKGGRAIGFGMAAADNQTVSFGWKVKMSSPLAVSEGGTGASNANNACAVLGAVKKSGDTMTGNLTLRGDLYPAIYLQPTHNNTANRAVFEGSYTGAASFASWEDATGNNRRMLEVRNAAAGNMDNALVLRTCTGGTWGTHRIFHAGMSTSIPVANGGTGANSSKAALRNLGIFYAETLPASGTDGQICLVPVG